MRDADIPRRRVLAAAGLAAALPARAAVAAPAKPRVAMVTDHGPIVVELEAARAPLTSANFLHYVDARKYDEARFFRTTHPKGEPANGTIVASPKPGVRPFAPIAHESTTQTGLRHRAGTISLGRFNPGSATFDFFICLGDEPYLDADPRVKGDNLGYAAFGQVVRGMGTVRRIHALPANGHSPFPAQKGEWLNKPAIILTARRA